MITRRISLNIAALASLGLALAVRSGAQVIVQTFTIPSQSVPFSTNFTFNLFDTTLGTLGAVTLTVNTTVQADVDIFNSTGVNQNYSNATASIPVTVTGPGPTVDTATGVAGPFAGTASPGLNTVVGAPVNASNTANVPVADFGLYSGIGPGTGTLTAAGSSGSYAGVGPPGVFFGGSAVASGTITLTYRYQPAGTIPEPGATTFLAAGVLGSLGMVLRRRRRK